MHHHPGFDGRSLEPLCEALSRAPYNLTCYCVDIRGHGFSGGVSGDSPDKTQLWKDVRLDAPYVLYI